MAFALAEAALWVVPPSYSKSDLVQFATDRGIDMDVSDTVATLHDKADQWLQEQRAQVDAELKRVMPFEEDLKTAQSELTAERAQAVTLASASQTALGVEQKGRAAVEAQLTKTLALSATSAQHAGRTLVAWIPDPSTDMKLDGFARLKFEDLLRKKAIEELGVFGDSASMPRYLVRYSALVSEFKVDSAMWCGILKGLLPKQAVEAMGSERDVPIIKQLLADLYLQPHELQERVAAVLQLRQTSSVVTYHTRFRELLNRALELDADLFNPQLQSVLYRAGLAPELLPFLPPAGGATSVEVLYGAAVLAELNNAAVSVGAVHHAYSRGPAGPSHAPRPPGGVPGPMPTRQACWDFIRGRCGRQSCRFRHTSPCQCEDSTCVKAHISLAKLEFLRNTASVAVLDMFDTMAVSAGAVVDGRASSRRGLVAQVLVAGSPLEALVDTGSPISLISRALVTRLGLQRSALRGPVQVAGLHGKPEVLDDSVEVPVVFDSGESRTVVAFVSSTRIPLLLGMDFIAKHVSSIDPLQGTVSIAAVDLRELAVDDDIKVLLQRRASVFVPRTTSARLPEAHLSLLPGKTGPNRPPYPLSPPRLADLRRIFVDLVRRGVVVQITPSEAQCASPVFLVPKKERGVFRAVVDFTGLNTVTEPAIWPMPRVNDVLQQLAQSRVFSTLDLSSAYMQLPLSLGAQQLCAVVTPFGMYRFRRLPLGLKQAPGIFQAALSRVIVDLTGVLNYLDDIVVFSADRASHLRTLEEVLRRLDVANLAVKLEKCRFALRRIEYLGHEVQFRQIRPSRTKVSAILDAPLPSSRAALHSWSALAGYYSRFVSSFARLAQSLFAASIDRSSPWEFTPELAKAISSIKHQLCRDPVLRSPDYSLPFWIDCDASDLALGAVLQQEDRPIEYWSAKMSVAEQKYPTFEKEMLAMVRALRRFRQYVFGQRVIVRTDHANILSSLLTASCVNNARLARWLQFMNSHDLVVRHRRGVLHANADFFSRVVAVAARTEVAAVQVWSAEMLLSMQRADQLLQADVALHQEQYSKDADGVLSRGEQIVVPLALVPALLQVQHADNHFGVDKMVSFLKMYRWLGKRRDIENFVALCGHCQRAKAVTPPVGNMKAIVATRPFGIVGIDFYGPLPAVADASSTVTSVLTIVDKFSKLVMLQPVRDQTARSAADGLLAFVTTYGVPEALISDRGQAFVGRVFAALSQTLGIERRLTTAYKPSTNGQCERIHRPLGVFLRGLADRSTWPVAVRVFAFRYNLAATHLGVSPLDVVFRWQARSWTDISVPDLPDAALADTLALADRIMRAQATASASQKQHYDASRLAPPVFRVGDLVLLRNHAAASKLEMPFRGPFLVLAVPTELTLVLSINDKEKTVSIQHVAPYRALSDGKADSKVVDGKVDAEAGDDDAKRAAAPAADDVQYAIDRLLQHREHKEHGSQYLVLWEGLPADQATWEPVDNLPAPVVSQFYVQQHSSVAACLASL